MKTKTLNGITYIAQPAMVHIDRFYRPREQSCSGCAAQYDSPLCEALQECFEDKIIWKKNDIRYNAELKRELL